MRNKCRKAVLCFQKPEGVPGENEIKGEYKQQLLKPKLQEDCHRNYLPRYYIFLHRSEAIAANRGDIQEKARQA